MVSADNGTSVTWGVVWKLGRERRLRLVITDVPSISRREVLAALEGAGYSAVFAEGGIPWLNHQVVPEASWPSMVSTDTATGRVTWEQLEGRQKSRKLSIDLEPGDYAKLVLAAQAAGEQLYPWCRRRLVEAAS